MAGAGPSALGVLDMVVFVLPVLGPWPSSVVDVSVSSRSRESSETWVSKSDASSFLHGRSLVHGVPVDLGHLLQVYPVCTVGAGSMNPGSLGSGRGSRSACIMAIRSLISDVCVVAGGSRRVWVTWPEFFACLPGGYFSLGLAVGKPVGFLSPGLGSWPAYMVGSGSLCPGGGGASGVLVSWPGFLAHLHSGCQFCQLHRC